MFDMRVVRVFLLRSLPCNTWNAWILYLAFRNFSFSFKVYSPPAIQWHAWRRAWRKVVGGPRVVEGCERLILASYAGGSALLAFEVLSSFRSAKCAQTLTWIAPGLSLMLGSLGRVESMPRRSKAAKQAASFCPLCGLQFLIFSFPNLCGIVTAIILSLFNILFLPLLFPTFCCMS